MKKLICFLLIGLFSCQKEDNAAEHPASDKLESIRWTTYEGRVPLNEKTNLYMEVSLLPADRPGEGSFTLHEWLEVDFLHTPLSSFEGKYSTLYGETPAEAVIQFHNSAQATGLKRTYLTRQMGNLSASSMRVIREELFRDTDLAVKIQGDNKLIVLDGNSVPVTLDAQFNLTKRTSKLFTLEGYFRHNGDTAEFYEMNTHERWAVSKLGAYYHAIRQYHLLTKAKFEVTYLKATGFSVRQTNKARQEIDALVLKRVLQMTASPNLTEEYNRLNP